MSFKLLFSLIVGLVVVVKADSFANFYDDSNCSVNGGIGVDINNDQQCIPGAGRASVLIPNTGRGSGQTNRYCLVITSNGGDCNCQTVGYDFTATGFCKTLSPSDQGYRFLHRPCNPNDC